MSLAGCRAEGQGENAQNGVPPEGVDKSDVYTWFEVGKHPLPDREQCQKIVAGMSLNEVIRALGRPQRDVGYGASLFQFDVADGSVFTVTFVPTATDGALSAYDKLAVAGTTFDMGIPDVYFPQQTVLSELFPWMQTLGEDEVTAVRREAATIGVAPFLFKDIAYSTDEEDIRSVYHLFSSPLHAISGSEGQVDGGGYVRYDLTANGQTYSVTISNQNVLIDGQYYRFEGRTADMVCPDLVCHSFITYPFCDSYEIFTYGEEGTKIGEFEGLGEFEFQASSGLPARLPQYTLKADGMTLLLLSEREFVIEGDKAAVLYTITGERDFSELFHTAA